MSESRSTADIAKSAVAEHVSEVANLSKDAIGSGGWTYPLLGILYFVTHPSLVRAVAPTIFKSLGAGLGITAGMFLFTYLPQVAFCALFSGPFAFLAAVPLVLGESYALTMFVTRSFFMAKAQEQLFDAVMVQQGNEVLVSRGRHITSGTSGAKKLGTTIAKPFANKFSKEGLIRYVVSLPLNAIPVVGVALFLLFNGKKAGPGFHSRYFQLKEYDTSRRNTFIERRQGAYIAFGATALALNLVPVVGLVFNFTSTVGAALWASQIEKKSAPATPAGATRAPVPEEKEVKVEL